MKIRKLPGAPARSSKTEYMIGGSIVISALAVMMTGLTTILSFVTHPSSRTWLVEAGSGLILAACALCAVGGYVAGTASREEK